MRKVIVIGGGAAGMMAAYGAALSGNQVTLIEKNEKLGKKLFITGKGRCNVTNACDTQDLFQNFIRNKKFMYSSVYTFDNFAVMDFFESHGLALKTERGDRVFPQSDHSSDVIRTLERALQEQDVTISYHTKVVALLEKDKCITGVTVERSGKKQNLFADAVICACGGCSYPVTGSDGDSYRLAKQVGHTVTRLVPSLVPVETKEDYIPSLQGISLRNVNLTLFFQGKEIYSGFGEMLFTHFGLSGPLVLSASSVANDYFEKGEVQAEIDLKPALSVESLDKRICRDFDENKNKAFKNAVTHLLPAKMIPVMISLSGIDPERKVNGITKEERQKLVTVLKHFPCTITGLRGFKEAIITRGGIQMKEINPSTMESKKIKHLYFAGEGLDLDALTGGFNLQIAWSTGYLAGISCLADENETVQ